MDTEVDPTAKLLQAYLERHQMSQRALAGVLDLKPQILNRWLRGRVTPSLVWKRVIHRFLRDEEERHKNTGKAGEEI